MTKSPRARADWLESGRSLADRHDMEIAPGVKAARWLGLQLDDPAGKDWDEAVAIFDRRVRTRYLDPVDLLLRSEAERENRWLFGFTILAIDCLLVETLQAFRMGLTNTRKRSKDMFRRFLTERPRFSQHFKAPQDAEAFWEHVRCGILHQAEVRGGWRVWAVGPLITPLDKGFRVNRTAFHESLAAEFEDYKAELKDPHSTVLRANMRTKMEYVCTAT